MKNLHQQLATETNLLKGATDLKDIPLTVESYITIEKVSVDKRTNLKNHSNVEVLFLNLFYKNKNEYRWEVTKTLKSFKDFLSHISYQMHLHSIHPPNDTFNSLLHYLKSANYAQFQRDTAQIISVLNDINSYAKLNSMTFVKEYFEVSTHSFVPYNNGIKPKEGYIKKQTEFNTCQVSCISMCKCIEACCCSSWIKCWFVLKEEMLCYLESSTSSIGKYTFWFDDNASLIKQGELLLLKNKSKKLQLKFENDFDRDIWYSLIKWRIDTYKEKNSINELGSFVNEKHECKGKFYVDGEDYFRDLHSHLLNAKETVFITDWWLSPEVYLIRPVHMQPYLNLEPGKALEEHLTPEKLTRLCDILNHIANKGVRIYILVFGEFALALTLNSKHTKKFLTNLHPNIQVTRHPKNTMDLLWSHHEKLVIIDQRYAFVGGLDLCWGRYDSTAHPLEEKKNDAEIYLFPGIDFSNGRVADFNNVDNYLKETESREMPRMPWHDIHSLVQGPVVLDIARHFVERWNYSNATSNKGGITDVQTKYTKTNTKFFPSGAGAGEGVGAGTGLALGGLKLNPIFDKIKEQAEEVNKKSDLENSKIQEEENFDEVHPKPQQQQRASLFPLPIGDKIHKNNFKQALFKKLNLKKNKRPSATISNWVNLLSYSIKFQRNEIPMTCQALRSLCDWSCGLEKTEHSILNGYYHLIDNAKHYIYIENQFFISKSFTEEEYKANPNVSDLVINEIALHLRNRIQRAYTNKEKFRVFIFIPLLPGFAGEIATSSTLQVILKYTYKTISRNKGLSLVEKLQEMLGDEYSQYISFFSLRQHGIVNNIPRTELIYIHSKLMIVDDLYVIMGSANINDRSMLGERDSEVAVIYKEAPTVKTKMNNEEFTASAYAKNLRMKLMSEHLGINYSNAYIIDDPLTDELYNTLTSTAKKNTEAYRLIFNCYPDDTMTAFKDIPPNKSMTMTYDEIEQLKERYTQNKGQIKGHIVQFPLNFLKTEILNRSFFSAEMLVPIKNFV